MTITRHSFEGDVMWQVNHVQLTKEEGHRNEAESRLHVALETIEENQKKHDLTIQDKDNEIRSLKEEVSIFNGTMVSLINGTMVSFY